MNMQKNIRKNRNLKKSTKEKLLESFQEDITVLG